MWRTLLKALLLVAVGCGCGAGADGLDDRGSGGTLGSGGNDDAHEQLMFVGTLDGKLHSFDR